MQIDSRIYVAGHRGLVGSALVRVLEKSGYQNIVTRSHKELDLLNESAVRSFFMREKPDYVFLAAARVGGILANNQYPVEFLAENLAIQNNIILASRDANVEKLLFLGSSCIYPKMSPQPIKEEYLLTGSLEPTNASYALAKIAGINLCQSCHREYGCNFISVMPTNLYGPNDNFDLNSSHVLPALLRKTHVAKVQSEPTLTIWGTGTPRREFLHVDDLASACLFLMDSYNSPDIVNIGTGTDITIAELAHLIMETVGYEGELVFDTEKPDGTPRKVLDVSRLNNLGWKPSIGLREGIRDVYESVDKSAWAPGSKI
jgi:GDP-L-fucose synthase